MRGYHSGSRVGRAFVVTRYEARDGGMRPTLPERCLGAPANEPKPCRLRISHYRTRKTGPSYPVAVLWCGTHRLASTLYPPGHVPYGRVAVAPVDAQGELILSRLDDAAEPRVPAWEATIFAAALSAAAGELWRKETTSRNSRADDAQAALNSPTRRTQGRHLRLAAELLGIDPSLAPSSREAVARALAVPCLELRQAAHELEEAVKYRDRACVIVRVLLQLRSTRGLGGQLLTTGELARLWGPARRWDPGGRAVRRSGPRP